MTVTARINKIEKAIEELRTPEDELQKIFLHLKSQHPMTMGPIPKMGWFKESRSLTDEEIMAKAKSLHKQYRTLERVLEWEAQFYAWTHDGVLDQAIADEEARQKLKRD